MPKPKKLKKPKLPERVKNALHGMIGYLQDDELESAREFYKEHGDLSGHIYEDVLAVSDWLDGTKTTNLAEELNIEEDEE